MITRGIVYIALLLIFYWYCKEDKSEVTVNEPNVTQPSLPTNDIFDIQLNDSRVLFK